MIAKSICAALEAASAFGGGVRTIEHDGRMHLLSYETLLGHACTIGGALRARGLEPGQRVALVMPDVGDFVRAFFGISAAGLVPVPLCPPAQAGDVPTFVEQSRDLLAAGRVSAVVTSADVAPLLDIGGIEPEPAVFTIDALGDGPAMTAPFEPSLDATALLQFTSGSTAAPKGVVLSHRNIHANATAIAEGLDITPADVGVSWLPLYHDMGLMGMLLAAVYAPVPVVIMSPILFLKRPSAWLQAISTYGGTVSFAPNFAYDLCRRRVKPTQIDTLDLSRWRVAGCGAEPVRPDTLRAFAEQFSRTGFRASSFVPSYGLAEHCLAVTFSRGLKVDSVDANLLVRDSRAVPVVNGDPSVRVVRCGRAFPGHALQVVDEASRTLPERHVGMIVVKGPSVMAGYFDNPVATRETLQGGWLLTGDLGYIADGDLYVCGRTKDLIIRQGRKYHPPDLESTIADARGVPVSGVVVFGINHVEHADEVVAVLEARASVWSDDIIDHVRRRIRETAGLELDRVVVTPPGTIPRTTSGKVRRAETRARFEAGTLLSAGREV